MLGSIASTTSPGWLKPGDYLIPGDVIWSPQRNVQFRLQNDGNLVAADWLNKLVWSPQTENRGGTYLIMQWDGNLVLYKGTPTIVPPITGPFGIKLPGTVSGTAVWASNTSGHPGLSLAIQDDGNLVLYDSNNKVYWASNSSGRVSAHLTLKPITSPDRIKVGEALFANQSIKSPNGQVTLMVQPDGDITLRDWTGYLMWHSNTAGSHGANPGLRVAEDGNIILAKSEDNSLIWSPQTENRGGVQLLVQDDGNVVLYTSGMQPIWSTNTMHRNAFKTEWGTVGSWRYPNVPPPVPPTEEWYANNTPTDVMHYLVDIYSHVLVKDIPLRELDILHKWAIAVQANHLFGEKILLPWTDDTSPAWGGEGSAWLIRRDDENYNKDLETLKNMRYAPDPNNPTLALRPFVATQGKDWGTFGIEGFHIENVVGVLGTVAGAVLQIIPGVGTAVGAGLIAGSQAAQKAINAVNASNQSASQASQAAIGAQTVIDIQTAVETAMTNAEENYDLDTSTGKVTVTQKTPTVTQTVTTTTDQLAASIQANPVPWMLGGLGLILLLTKK